MNGNKPLSRAQLLLLYLILTGGIATGLAIFSSASTILDMIRTATEGLFLPLLLSVIVTFLLDPPVRYVERKGLSRTGSIFLVFLLVFVVASLLASAFSANWQAMWLSLKSDLPRYTAGLISFLKDLQANLHDRLPYIENYDLPSKARVMAEQLLAQILVETPKSALRLGSLMVLVPFFSFFFLRDGQRIMRSTIALTPNRHFEMAHDLSYLVSRQLAQFVRGRLLEAFIIGLVVTAGLSMTDIRYAPILGLVAGVTNLVPYIGPIVGMIPGLLIAFVDLGLGAQFWWIVVVYVLIAQVLVDNFILIPVLISRVANLHPLWVVLAIIMGGKLYGVIGMIIGVPIASIIKIAILEIRHYRSNFALPEHPLERESIT